MIIICCSIMAIQDFRERAVSWILFPLLAGALSILHFESSAPEQFLVFIISNILLVSAIVLILFLYTRVILHKAFLNTSFGLGDLLFFYAFALGFPTFTFILLFVGAVLFSLLAFLVTKLSGDSKLVPLAGFMSLFLIAVILASLLPQTPSLYLL